MGFHEGNQFFRHRHTSISIEDGLKYFKTFEEFERYYKDDLMGENLLLGEYLDHLLYEREISANRVSEAIGKSHSYVRKITSGSEVNPSRDVLLAICVYIGTSIEETQILLRYAGKAPLYVRRKRDVIIWYALNKHQSLADLNIYLEDHGYPSLSKLIVQREK